MHIAPLTGKAREAAGLSTARLNVYEGAVRSGKTIASLLAWMKFVRDGPDGPLLMVGKTERTLRRNIIDPMVEMLGPTRCRLIAGTGDLWLLGRRVYIVGANDERAQEKIRGLTLAGAYVDEATTIPETFWVMLLTRLSILGARLIATTNPDSSAHWLKKEYLNRAKLHLTRTGNLVESHSDDAINLHRFSFQLADNPTLPASFVKSLEQEFAGLWYKRLVLGEWVLAEGAIYDMWDEDRHVVDILPRIVRWVALGVDYGTVNPFSAGLLGLGADGVMYRTREWRYDSKIARRQLTDSEYSERLRGWLATVPVPTTTLQGVRPEYVVVDPSAASFVTQLHRDGLTPTLADNSVEDGIRTVASLFARDLLKVHRSCTGLIEEIPGYAWDDEKSLKGEEVPIKVDDHGCDDLRYGVHTTQSLWRGQIGKKAA